MTEGPDYRPAAILRLAERVKEHTADYQAGAWVARAVAETRKCLDHAERLAAEFNNPSTRPSRTEVCEALATVSLWAMACVELLDCNSAEAARYVAYRIHLNTHIDDAE